MQVDSNERYKEGDEDGRLVGNVQSVVCRCRQDSATCLVEWLVLGLKSDFFQRGDQFHPALVRIVNQISRDQASALDCQNRVQC